jgi:hypothetical protein
MTFAQAYPRLFEGRGIRRQAWEPGMVVRLSAINADHLVMHYVGGNRSVFCPAASDLYDRQLQQLRDDWEVVL